tara:strand:+ start:435 stop:836 length:402 start_codon:yes stop_codon:yes gene_type:complete
MALESKKHKAIHGKTGNDLAVIKASFDNGEHTDLTNYGPEAALIYQMQKMQDELDYLRTEVSANKDKTGITSDQANAITANTAKVSLAGGSATTISFGELITTRGAKGQPSTYTIVMTAVKAGVSKTVTLTLT